jgi:glycosyltransferase involved in cell wall biosynthesis
MSLDRPLVSICLPVYNGETYAPQAIRSILNQTFEHFELIISDNASTDRTGAICRETAARDPRVRYYQADTNRGLAWNHNRAFELARGNYVAWIGHDDVMGREYIARCVNVLQADSRAVLAFSHFNYIDDKGNVTQRIHNHNSGASDIPSVRLRSILQDTMCDPIYGLMKASILKQTCLHRGFADSDRVLLAEMGLRGRFALVPEYLFSRRMHAHGTTSKYRSVRERTLIFDPAKAGTLFFPGMLETMALCSVIRRTTLPWRARLSCYRTFLRWLLLNRRRLVWNDLRDGLSSAITSYLSDEQIRRLTPAKGRLLKAWFGSIHRREDIQTVTERRLTTR